MPLEVGSENIKAPLMRILGIANCDHILLLKGWQLYCIVTGYTEMGLAVLLESGQNV